MGNVFDRNPLQPALPGRGPFTWFSLYLIPKRSDVANEVYDELRRGGLYLMLVALAAHVFWFYYDVSKGIMPGALLRLATIILCLVAGYAVTRPMTNVTRGTFIASMVGIVFVELETRFQAPDVPFWYFFAWSVYPIMMLFNAIVFLGPPIYYCLIFAGVLGIYEYRTSLYLGLPGADNHAIMDVQFYTVILTLLCCALNIALFRARYRNTLQKREIERLYEAALVEAELRAAAEKKLALVRERERVSADFHDNLGGNVTDLQMFLHRWKQDSPNAGDWDTVEKLMKSVVLSLKNVIQSHMDEEADVASGIQKFLLRRYSNAGRSMEFQGSAKACFAACLNEEERHGLFMIVQEVLNNDLKYGSGNARWSLKCGQGSLLLSLETETHSKTDSTITALAGFGHRILEQRVKDLGARMEKTIDENRYSLSVEIPTRPCAEIN